MLDTYTMLKIKLYKTEVIKKINCNTHSQQRDQGEVMGHAFNFQKTTYFLFNDMIL